MSKYPTLKPHITIAPAVALLDACNQEEVIEMLPYFMASEAVDIVSSATRLATRITAAQNSGWVGQIRILDNALHSYRLTLASTEEQTYNAAQFRVAMGFLTEVRDYVATAATELEQAVELTVDWGQFNQNITETTILGVGQALTFLTRIVATLNQTDIETQIGIFRREILTNY